MAAFLVGTVSATHAQAVGGPCRYFAETGHYVCGPPLELYETRGGVEIYGYPLSEPFDDPVRGLRVQYFQRARMEWHPADPDSQVVTLGRIADELGFQYPPIAQEDVPSRSGGLHKYFPETGHVVSYAFREYFHEKGGLDTFGYPLSEILWEDGCMVQYFERARMEWRPEASPGLRVRLTNLVEIYLDRFDIPREYLKPIEGKAGISRPLIARLDVSVSVRRVVTGQEDLQELFVYVEDQRELPVRDALVKADIPSESAAHSCTFNPTDSDGFTECSFQLDSPLPGKKVVIDVTVTYGELRSTKQASFLTWW